MKILIEFDYKIVLYTTHICVLSLSRRLSVGDRLRRVSLSPVVVVHIRLDLQLYPYNPKVS